MPSKNRCKGFNASRKNWQKNLKELDWYFGTPVTVNYRGDEHFKSYWGACFSVFVIIIMSFFFLEGLNRMVNKLDPDLQFLRKTKSRPSDDPLNLPDIYGQMFIGLRNTTEYDDGRKEYEFIDLDPTYINGKIDYHKNRNLTARQDMSACEGEDEKAFNDTVKNSNGIQLSDFGKLKCIPPQRFNLYNDASSPDANSISLIFEQCGGKYQKPKDFSPGAVSNLEDDQSVSQEDWQWTPVGCDENIPGGCTIPGLTKVQPQSDNSIRQSQYQYSECTGSDAASNKICTEFWTPIDCPYPSYECFSDLVETQCGASEEDHDCQLGFLRAMCEQYDVTIEACKNLNFRRALAKVNDCQPGKRWCDGYQEIFGGPYNTQCPPWEFDCAIKAYFGVTVDVSDEKLQDPLLKLMAKSNLTISEAELLNDYALVFSSGMWLKGLQDEPITLQEKDRFYKLGQKIFSDLGFSAIFQGKNSTISRTMQDQIDAAARQYMAQIQLERLNTPFMPLSSIKALEFKRVLNWQEDVYQTQALTKCIDYEELTEYEVEICHELGGELFVDKETFLTALYQKNALKQHQQDKIDVQMRDALTRYIPRKATGYFPDTELTDEEMGDALRAVFLVAGQGLEDILRGIEPPASFNKDVFIFDDTVYDSLVEWKVRYAPLEGPRITPTQQFKVDNSLRGFLQLHEIKVKTDKDVLAQVKAMPLTKLTRREYADLLAVQRKGYSDLFDRGMQGELTGKELKSFLVIGSATWYGTEGTHSFHYQFKEIDWNQQITIDQHIRALALPSLKAVIPGLPKTTLTENEVNKVSDIMKLKLCCDLWQRKISGERITNAGHKKEIEVVGKQLTGNNNHYTAFFGDISLTQAEQSAVDQQVRDFIAQNTDLSVNDRIEIAGITGQTQSFLTKQQNERIREIMRYKIPIPADTDELKIQSYWDDLFYPVPWVQPTLSSNCDFGFNKDAYIQKGISDQSAQIMVRRAGTELMGGKFFQALNNKCMITSADQAIIDERSQEFISKNAGITESDQIKEDEFAIIKGMGDTVLLANEYEIIDYRAELMLPGLWKSKFYTNRFFTMTADEQMAVFEVAARVWGNLGNAKDWIQNNKNFGTFDQIDLDDSALKFLEKYSTDALAIADEFIVGSIPGVARADILWLPYTTISAEDWDLAQDIANFQTNGLFGKAAVDKSLEKVNEHDQLYELIDRMFGSQPGDEIFNLYWLRDSNYRIVQESKTRIYDDKIREFIDKYKTKETSDKIPRLADPIVSLTLMPLTTLHAGTIERLNKVNNYRMTESAWTSLWVDPASLQAQDADVVTAYKQIITEMFNNDSLAERMWAPSLSDFTLEEQKIIDDGINAYIPCCKDRKEEYTQLYSRMRHLASETHPTNLDLPDQRILQEEQIAAAVENSCKDEELIREYFKNKSIVVFATESFVLDPEEEESDGGNIVSSYLKPIAEKRLDFRYHKEIGAQVEEQAYIIKDGWLQIEALQGEDNQIDMSKTTIVSEDVVTREYWDGRKGDYVNTQESMLTINFELVNTMIESTRTDYSLLVFLSDVGGLMSLLISGLGIIVSFIVGEQYTQSMLKSLYMMNLGDPKTGDQDQTANDNQLVQEPSERIGVLSSQLDVNTIELGKEQNQEKDQEKDYEKERLFLEQTKPYEMPWKESQLISHYYLRYLDCRYCRSGNQVQEAEGETKICCFNFEKSFVLKKVFDKGQERVEKGLDVRNLIKTQEMLRSMLYVLKPGVAGEEKRKLMRIQRRQRVLEPSSSDFDSEVDDLKDFKRIYEDVQAQYLQLDKEEFARYRNAHVKPSQQQLLEGVFSRYGLKPKGKNTKREVEDHKKDLKKKGLKVGEATRQEQNAWLHAELQDDEDVSNVSQQDDDVYDQDNEKDKFVGDITIEQVDKVNPPIVLPLVREEYLNETIESKHDPASDSPKKTAKVLPWKK